MQIGARTVATFHYTLTDASGKVIDSSVGGEPLAYLHGAGNIVPGLEKALTGKRPGGTPLVLPRPPIRDDQSAASPPVLSFRYNPPTTNVSSAMPMGYQSPA